MIASLSVVAIFLIAFLPLPLGAKTVKLVEICSSGSRVNMVVYRYNPVTLRMTSGAWEADQLSCTATFRAEDLDETLYYHFSDYANTDGTELRLERKRSVTFVSEGTYSAARTPALEYAKKADTYLRVTVDRDSLVISHGFNFTLVISNKGNSGLLPSLSSGTVVGSVVGGGASIIGLALVIVLCRSKTRRRAHWRRSGTTNPGVSTMTVCTTTPGVYQMPPHTMQRGQLPSYPSGYPQPAHASLCQQPVQSWGPSQAVAVSAYLPANNLPAYGQHGTAPGYPLPPSGSTIPPTHHPNGGLSNAHGDGPNLPGYVSHRPEYRSAAPPTYESLGFTDNNKS